MQKPEVTAQNKAKALELLRTGLSVRAVAKEVGVTPQTICLWTQKDADYNDAWEASVIANHMAVIATYNEDLDDFLNDVRHAIEKRKTKNAPLLAIVGKAMDSKVRSSTAVLTRLAKNFAEKLETNNKTELSGGLSVSDVAKMDDGALHDTIRNLTQQG